MNLTLLYSYVNLCSMIAVKIFWHCQERLVRLMFERYSDYFHGIHPKNGL